MNANIDPSASVTQDKYAFFRAIDPGFNEASHEKALAEAAARMAEGERANATRISTNFSQLPIPLVADIKCDREFPVDALSNTLKGTVDAIVDKIQCPKALAAMSVMGAASLAAQAHVDVVIPATGQIKPVSLYLLSIAESGERKTSADMEALRSVKEYEKELNVIRDAQLPAYRNAFDVWEAERKHILHDRKLSAAERAQRLAVLHQPQAPLTAIITSSEPTIEGLYNLFVTGQPSLGIFSSEGGEFVGSHGMQEDARTRTGAALNSLWDGEIWKRVRVNERHALIGRRLSLHLMVQPVIASQFLSLQDLQGQGLFSRILIAYPKSTMGTRLQRERATHTDAWIDYYAKQLLAIFRMALPLSPDTNNQLTPKPLTFDNGAKDRWNAYSNEVEKSLLPECPYASIKGFAGKLIENASRIAGVMTFIENCPVDSIGVDILERAIAICDYFAEQALAMHEGSKIGPDIRNAQDLLKWLQNDWHEPFVTTRVVQKKGPHAIKQLKSEGILKLMNILLEHGYLEKYYGAGEILVDGHVTDAAFAVRPKA